MKYLQIYENFSNSDDLIDDAVLTLIDMFDEFNVVEMTQSSTNTFSFPPLYTYFNGTITSLPDRFFRTVKKIKTNYLIIYTYGSVPLISDLVKKSIEKLKKIHNVELAADNILSICHYDIGPDEDQSRTRIYRSWIIEIKEE